MTKNVMIPEKYGAEDEHRTIKILLHHTQIKEINWKVQMYDCCF